MNPPRHSAPCRLLLGILLGAAAGTVAAAPPDGAVERLSAAVRGALERAPELRAAAATADVDRAAAALKGAAGTPWVDLQQEGIGAGLSTAPNAQTTLRFQAPFNLPWQASAARSLRETTDTMVAADREAGRMDVAGAAAMLWLDAAAASDRLAVATTARERLDRALALHEERYTLGEVAGIDVLQLDLEQVRAATAEAAVAAEREALVARLRRFAGHQAPLPRPGDLAELIDASASLPVEAAPAALAETTPLLASAVRRAEAAGAARDLVAAVAWGRPVAEAEWERIPTIAGVPGHDAVGLRVSVPLPLGRSGRDARAEADAAARLALAELELEQRRLANRLEAAATAAAGAERRLGALTPVLQRLPEAERSVAEQFRLGALSYLVYIDGVARFDEIEIAAVAARRELLAARVELAVILARPDLFPLPTSPLAEEAP